MRHHAEEQQAGDVSVHQNVPLRPPSWQASTVVAGMCCAPPAGRGMMETEEDSWCHEGLLGLRGDRGVQSRCERLFPLYREELEALMWACCCRSVY